MTTKSFIKTIGSKGLLSDYNTEGKKLQTELTAGDNVTIANNVISAEKQVIYAEYGKTSYDTIKNAIINGFDVIVRYSGNIYHSMHFAENNTGTIYFKSIGADEIREISVNSSEWKSYSTGFQKKLTFDTTPKAGSNNPVTSDGIKTALDAKQDTLTAGNNVTITDNVISSNQVFVATYGTTTYAEVKAAYDAGKICTVFRNDLYYYLNLIDKDRIRFISQTPNPVFGMLTVSSTDSWEFSNSWLQSRLTFDTTPTAGSNNPVTSDGIKTALDSRVPAPTSTTGTQVLKCVNGVIQWVNE